MSKLVIPLILCLGVVSLAQGEDAKPNMPPIEEQPSDPKAKKIVLIAGSNFFKAGEHEYVGGCALLLDLLKQTPGVAPVLAIDWPKKEETLKDAKAVVFFFDGAEKHQVLKDNRPKEIAKLLEAKVGLVQLHQTADYPKDFGSRAQEWAGAVWEKGVSERAHWVHEFKEFPNHEITRGVETFKIDDGWLFKMKFIEGQKGVTPLLRTRSPKSTAKPTELQDVVAWAYDRPNGGRSFTFTGGHLQESFGQAGYRRLIVNGILWSAGIEIPKDGAKCDLGERKPSDYLKPPMKKSK